MNQILVENIYDGSLLLALPTDDGGFVYLPLSADETIEIVKMMVRCVRIARRILNLPGRVAITEAGHA